MEIKTNETTIYLMRQGYKGLEGADSIKDTMKEEDNNKIRIFKTLKEKYNILKNEFKILKETPNVVYNLRDGIMSDIWRNLKIDLNCNPLTEIATSRRLRSELTGDRLKVLCKMTKGNSSVHRSRNNYRLSDMILLSENEAGKNPYFKNQTIDSISDGSESWYFKSIFDDNTSRWAINKAEQGINKWERLKMILMSDPYLKGKKPIPKETFGASMPAYEIGERGFLELSEMIYINSLKNAESFKNNVKRENLAVISQSAIIEPIVAYAILNRETANSENMKSQKRNMFYEILHDLITYKIGDNQWDFTEYTKISWENISETNLNKFKNKIYAIPPELVLDEEEIINRRGEGISRVLDEIKVDFPPNFLYENSPYKDRNKQQQAVTKHIKINKGNVKNILEIKHHKLKNIIDKGIEEAKVSSISGFRGYNL